MAAILGLCLIFSVMHVDDSDILLVGEPDDDYNDILRKNKGSWNKME